MGPERTRRPAAGSFAIARVRHRLAECSATSDLPFIGRRPARGGGAAGLHLEVCRLRSGRCISTRTFADGSFYLVPLPPGEYEASVARSDLAELDVPRDRGRARLRIAASAEGPEAPFVEIRLGGSRTEGSDSQPPHPHR